MRFWYRFIYPNLSEIAMGNGERVYDKAIAPYLTEYVRESLRDVCGEYLQVMNRYKQLRAQYGTFGVWYGKVGTIDVVAKSADGACLVGFCDCGVAKTDEETLTGYAAVLESAGLKPTECYVFSMQGFTAEVEALAAEQGITLVCAKDM